MQRCWRSSVWIHTVLLVEVQRVFVCCRRLSTFRGVESHHRQHRQHTESKEVRCEPRWWGAGTEKPRSELFFSESISTHLLFMQQKWFIKQEIGMRKWLNARMEGRKQLAILHDDNLLRANAHLNIPGNTSEIVVSDKYGLHNSIWLILNLQARGHISPLIRFICCFHGTRLYHYH